MRMLTGLAAVLASLTLGVPPAGAADPAHDPAARCDYYRQSGVLVFAGVASVPAGHAPNVRSLTITCTYLAQGDVVATSTSTLAAPVVVTYGSSLVPAFPITVCAEATATYADGHTGTFPETCILPA